MKEILKVLKSQWFIASIMSLMSPVLFVFLAFLYTSEKINKSVQEESLLLSGMLVREIANAEKTLASYAAIILSQGHNENQIEKVLLTISKSEIPFFLGSYVSLANKDGEITINGMRGRIHDGVHIRDREYYAQALKRPNTLHIMNPSKDKFSSGIVIPTCLSFTNKQGDIAGILVLGIRMDAFVNRLRPFIELDEKIYVFCKEGHFYLEITSGTVQIESLSSYPDAIPENQIIVKKLGFAAYLEKIKLLLGVAIFILLYFFLIVFYKKKIIHKTIVAPLERALKIKSKTSFFGYYFSIEELQKMLINAENIFDGIEKLKKNYIESRDSCSALVRFYEKGVYQFYKKILLMRSKALLLKNKSEHDKDISDFMHEVSVLDFCNLDFTRSDFCLFDLVHDAFLTIKPLSEKNGMAISFSKERGIDKKIFYGCYYYYAYLLRCILHYIMEIMISHGNISIDLAHHGKNDAM